MSKWQGFVRRYKKCRTGYPLGPFSVAHALRHAWWEVTHG